MQAYRFCYQEIDGKPQFLDPLLWGKEEISFYPVATLEAKDLLDAYQTICAAITSWNQMYKTGVMETGFDYWDDTKYKFGTVEFFRQPYIVARNHYATEKIDKALPRKLRYPFSGDVLELMPTPSVKGFMLLSFPQEDDYETMRWLSLSRYKSASVVCDAHGNPL